MILKPSLWIQRNQGISSWIALKHIISFHSLTSYHLFQSWQGMFKWNSLSYAFWIIRSWFFLILLFIDTHADSDTEQSQSLLTEVSI